MTLARSLPERLAPRFRGAARATLRSEVASIEAVVADRFRLRLRGLAGLDRDAIVPLLFPRCRSVHTLGMRASIDVVWLDLGADEEGRVLDADLEVAPGGLTRAPRGTRRNRTAALELAAGDARQLGLDAGGRARITVE